MAKDGGLFEGIELKTEVLQGMWKYFCEKFYCFPPIRNYGTSELATRFILKAIEDESFDVVHVDDHHITIAYLGKRYKLWWANKFYASLDSCREFASWRTIWSGQMPSRWAVRQFAKKAQKIIREKELDVNFSEVKW